MATKVLAQQQSDVSLQGKIIRNRVPTSITVAAGGDDGDAIEWQVLTDGQQTWIVGQVLKGAKVGRQTPPRTAAPAKAAAKKGAAKKVGVKAPKVSLDDAFGEEDAFAAPAVSKPKKPTVAVPKKGAAPVAPPVRRVAVPTKGAKFTVPPRR